MLPTVESLPSDGIITAFGRVIVTLPLMLFTINSVPTKSNKVALLVTISPLFATATTYGISTMTLFSWFIKVGPGSYLGGLISVTVVVTGTGAGPFMGGPTRIDTLLTGT
jgi:hypothetical protein